MNTIRLAAAAAMLAAACVPAIAEASATYDLKLTGSGTDWKYAYNACPDQGGFCPVEWAGQVEVIVDSSHDGTFTSDDILSLSFGTNLGGVSWQHGDVATTFYDMYYGGYVTLGATGLPVVTVQDGVVTSIGFEFVTPGETYYLGGLSAGIYSQSVDITYPAHGDVIDAYGVLTAIPEPMSGVLLALGLLPLVLHRRRLQRTKIKLPS